MYQRDEILAAAQAIYPHLDALLGPAADSIAEELDRLLTEADRGQPVEDQIAALLASQAPTRTWTRFFLQGEEGAVVGPTRGYEALPGAAVIPIPARLYACPEPGCPTVWRCRDAGQPIPCCPQHGSLVVLRAGQA